MPPLYLNSDSHVAREREAAKVAEGEREVVEEERRERLEKAYMYEKRLEEQYTRMNGKCMERVPDAIRLEEALTLITNGLVIVNGHIRGML